MVDTPIWDTRLRLSGLPMGLCKILGSQFEVERFALSWRSIAGPLPNSAFGTLGMDNAPENAGTTPLGQAVLVRRIREKKAAYRFGVMARGDSTVMAPPILRDDPARAPRSFLTDEICLTRSGDGA